jgi:hypothetical protein
MASTMPGERSVTTRRRTPTVQLRQFEDVEAGAYVLQFGKPDQVVKAQSQQFTCASRCRPSCVRISVLRTGTLRVQVVAHAVRPAKPWRSAEVEMSARHGPGEWPARRRARNGV